ncbi:unnamed protein product [Adineta steineri]|uniref:Uncharacterized protein n=1 Tax=Adineta steineri TaxID=433720 RepID=A0A814M3N6_9BILA|nr:unnamed protein product [Adineta steineri]CAF3967979.1 unnamed protein product [Adineta steineri]
MYRGPVILFFMVFIVSINGVSIKPVSSTDNDAIELAQLAEKIWSLKPAALQTKGPLVICQFIDKYCTNENRFQAISSMVSSIVNEYRSKHRYARVLNKCISKTVLEETKQSCPILQQLISPTITQQDKFNIIQYQRVLMSYFTELNILISHVQTSCNDEEIHGFLCSSNMTLITTCTNKILREIYNDNNYEEVIIKTKQALTDLNQELLSLYIKTEIEN